MSFIVGNFLNMRIKLRHTFSIFLTVLMLFSTVGFNIISSFCEGCEKEHTTVSLVADIDSSCTCCESFDGLSQCCSSETHKQEHKHQTTSKLVKLLFDSPEAKRNIHTFDLSVNLLLLFYVLLFEQPVVKVLTTNKIFPLKIPESGRKLLSLHCILRN